MLKKLIGALKYSHVDSRNETTCLKRGMTLVETIIYVGLFILILVVVITSIDSLLKSQRNLKSHMAIQESAVAFLDRLVRETRDSESVDTVSSTLGVHPGSLVLNSRDETDNLHTFRFYIDDDGRIASEEDGVYLGPLTLAGVTIDNLVFNYIDTTGPDAVRVQVTLSSGAGSIMKSENFYTTVGLRSSF